METQTSKAIWQLVTPSNLAPYVPFFDEQINKILSHTRLTSSQKLGRIMAIVSLSYHEKVIVDGLVLCLRTMYEFPRNYS